MTRRRVDLLEVLLISAAVALIGAVSYSNVRSVSVQRVLFPAFAPSKLANCTLKRYGDSNDGGYVMCGNLMGNARAAYSYGIAGHDDWGCDVSRQLRTPVHEYDCFDVTRPLCERGTLQFHEECIGDRASIEDGRPYDALSNQLARNGDSGQHVIVKMDVEGAEWTALLTTPDSVLDMIDQLIVEFHGTNDAGFIDTVEKLKRHFYVVNFHANNYACFGNLKPFTAWANEVLLVNKRVGVLVASAGIPTLPNALDAPNKPSLRDCQPTF